MILQLLVVLLVACQHKSSTATRCLKLWGGCCRYDGLVGMYSGKDVPAVGVSIGVERVFTVLEAKLRAQAKAANRNIRATKTQVLVGSFGKGLQVRFP